jgi:integrase
VKLTHAIEIYVAEMKRAGQMRPQHRARVRDRSCTASPTSRQPRPVAPSAATRSALPRPLAHQNSQRQAHAILNSFFDFALEEGWRKDNPARQVRRAKPPHPERLPHDPRRDRPAAHLAESNDRRRDYWLAHLGCCAGLRSQEILGVQGRHFARPGFIGSRRTWGRD